MLVPLYKLCLATTLNIYYNKMKLVNISLPIEKRSNAASWIEFK